MSPGGQRHWIVFYAGNRGETTILAVVSVEERTASGFASYFEGSTMMPSDEEVGAGVEGVSSAMRRDWPKLPVDVKNALGAR